MSGVEIVGIVLGTLPLAITALEHYRDGLRTIQRWRRYERELQSLIRNLDTEQAKLQNVCEKLLTGLVPPSRIEAMVDSPLGELWLEEAVQQKVRIRLWRSWDIFQKNLRDMNAAIAKLMTSLGDITEINNNKSSTISIVRELKRATFALDRSAYADLLGTIREGVSNLESLISSNIELEPERRIRSRLRLLSIVRHVSLSLYRATRSSFKCMCRHDIGLKLSTYSADISPGDADETVTQRLRFYAALSHESIPKLPAKSYPSAEKHEWEEVAIEVVAIPTNTMPKSSSNPKQRSVRFASIHSSTSTSFTSSTSSTATATLTSQMSSLTLGHASSHATDQMANLCNGQTKAMRDCYGRIFDIVSPAEQRCFAVYPRPPHDQANCSMVSLHYILSHRPYSLTYRDRLQLAVFVASSVLQLYNTPWLPGLPNSNVVFFLIQEGWGKPPDSEHAFVIAGSSPQLTQPKQQPMDDASFPVKIRNHTLLALGILLVEIICGQTIDALRKPEDEQGLFDLDNTDNLTLSNTNNTNIATTTSNYSHKLLSDYIVARRQLSQIYQSSSNYGSAVRRCINGDFARQTLNLDDEDFRQEVYSGVVSLLEEDLGHT